MDKCDMCGTAIEKGECSCGTWKDAHELTEDEVHMRKSLEAFHEMKLFTLTADIPHLGVAVVFFRGDYKDSENVENFIRSMKGRPHYEK